MNYNTYICLDLETTGLDARVDDIIEIAMIKVVDGSITDRYEKLVYTPTELSDIVTFLTKIQNTDLEGAPEWKRIMGDVEEFISDLPIVGHNIQFDTTFLKEKGITLSNPEWDTYHMSTLLYPDLPSHSLETNSLYFNLTHDDSHRAMSDVLATHELWQIIIKSFPAIQDNQSLAIQELSLHSNWNLLEYFTQERQEEKIEYTFLRKDNEYVPIVNELTGSSDSSLLIHCPLQDPLSFVSESAKKQLIVAAYPHTQDKLHHLYPAANLFVSPHKRYCLERVEELKKKESYSDVETMLLLRTILYPERRNSAEMALSHGEKWIWNTIQANQNCMLNHTSDPAHQDYQEALQGNMVITSQYFLFSHPEMSEQFEAITILDPQNIKENATRATSWTLSEEVAKEREEEVKSTLKKEIFIELHRLLKELVPYSQYTEKILFGKEILSSPVIKSLQKTIADLKDTNEEVEGLKKFFTQADSETIRWFSINPRYGISLHMAPRDVSAIIDAAIGNKPVTIISNTVDQFSFSANIEVVSNKPTLKPKILLPELYEVKGTKKGGEHKMLKAFISKLLPSLSGKTAVVFSSKAKLKQYFFDIYTKELSTTMEMLGEDVGNGTGKLLDRYLSSQEHSKVIFLTFRNLRMYRPEHMDFDNILFQSIPFDPPPDPIISARTEHLQNPFMQYAIPVAKKNFLEVLGHFTKDPARDTKLYLIDPRFQSNYGIDFVQLV
jgi:DNA polymerase III epsilon subunit-like protein